MSMRSAASWAQPRQRRVVPWGARTMRGLAAFMAGEGTKNLVLLGHYLPSPSRLRGPSASSLRAQLPPVASLVAPRGRTSSLATARSESDQVVLRGCYKGVMLRRIAHAQILIPAGGE